MKHISIFGFISLLVLLLVLSSVNAAPLNDFNSCLNSWQKEKNIVVINITSKLNILKMNLIQNPTTRISNDQLIHLRKSFEIEADWREIDSKYKPVIDELVAKSSLSEDEQNDVDLFEIFELNVLVMINVRREVLKLASENIKLINSSQDTMSTSISQGWNIAADLGFANRDSDISETDRFLTLYQRYNNEKKRMQLDFTETIRYQNSYVNNTQLFGSFNGRFGSKNGSILNSKLSNLLYHDKDGDKNSRIDTDIYFGFNTPISKDGSMFTSYYNTNKDYDKLPQNTYNYNEYYLYLTNNVSKQLGYRYSFTTRAYDFPGANLNNKSSTNFLALDYSIPNFGRVNLEYNNTNKAYINIPQFGYVEQDLRARWFLNPYSDWTFIGNSGYIDSRQRGDASLSYYQSDLNFRIRKPLSTCLTADSYLFMRSKNYKGDNPYSFDQLDYNLTLNWTPNPQFYISGSHSKANYDYNDIQSSFEQYNNRLNVYYYAPNGDTISSDWHSTRNQYNIDDGRDYLDTGIRLDYTKFIKKHYLRLYLGYNSLDQDQVNSPNDYIQTKLGGEFNYQINTKQKFSLVVEKNFYDYKYNNNYHDNLVQMLYSINF